VLVLDSIGRLNLYTFIALNMVSTMMIGIGLIRWLLVANGEITWKGRVRERLQEYVRRWWRFASPLLVWEYYKPLLAYLSIYLLQHWYGSVEQGYFALASKWSAFVLVFTSSALSIFWREIAQAVANGERERAARIYEKFTHLLFFLSVVLCAWLSFGSPYLVQILVGEEYLLAVPILTWMAFYPLQQTYGQINIAALKGAEKTTVIRNLGILISIPDLLLTYFLLAPVDAPIPGLSLGALGVAIKMVVYGLISVQAYERICHRLFNLSYVRTFSRKSGVAVLVLISAILSMSVLGHFLAGLGTPPVVNFVIISTSYFLLIASLFVFIPELAGMNKVELLEIIHHGRSKILNLVKR
jgi:O-antigen/teichoic acid export membrane protein